MVYPEYALTATEQAIFQKEEKKIQKIVKNLSSISRDATFRILQKAKNDLEFGRDKLLELDNIVPWFVENIGQSDIEQFAAVFMDNNKNIVHRQILGEGSATRCTLFPRQIVHIAIAHNASNVIIAHNHPSGSTMPSSADRLLTTKLRNILEPLEITLIEHFVVVRDGDYYSFRSNNAL